MNDYAQRPPDFSQQLNSLIAVLEQWRKEAKAAEISHSKSQFNWHAAVASCTCYILSWASIPVVRRLELQSNHTWLSVTMCALFLLLGAAIFLEIRACGFATLEFWRELRDLFFKPDNYPFNPLSRCLREDLAAVSKLADFPTQILAAGAERIAAEEADLRERLTSILGTPTIAIVVGLIASVASGWQAFVNGPGFVSSAVFFSSLGITFLSVYGMRLRILLTELTRCRALLALELARRKSIEAQTPELA